jgi:hypothetical protein
LFGKYTDDRLAHEPAPFLSQLFGQKKEAFEQQTTLGRIEPATFGLRQAEHWEKGLVIAAHHLASRNSFCETK